MRDTGLRDRIRGGERLTGTFLKSRDPAAAGVLTIARYDFIVADLEHSPLTAGDVEGIIRACDCHDVPVIARIPASGLALCGALPDCGVTGIQVSDVTSAATAKAVRRRALPADWGTELDGEQWIAALPGDPPEKVPALPDTKA